MEDFLAKLVAFAIFVAVIWLVGLVISVFAKKPADKKDPEDEPK